MTWPFGLGQGNGLSKVRSWVTADAAQGETQSERSAERNRRAAVSAVAGLVFQGSSFAVILVSVPLTLTYLSPVRFGLWMTLASVVALLGATDLGIGNGVMNNVAHAFGMGDQPAARRNFASGLVALTGIAAIFAALFVVAYPMVPWARLYNVAADPQAASEAGPATAAFLGAFLLGLPLGLVGQVRRAFQEGFIQSAFAGFGNLITFGFLLLAVWSRASLPMLMIAVTAGPLIASVINLMVLIRRQRRWLTPRRLDVTKQALRSVLRVGLGFMVLQIAYAVAFSSDRLVVAQMVGPSAVADYSVVYRLFSIPAGLALVAMLPLWPAYREAISRSDFVWIRTTLKRALVLTVLATVPLAIVLAILGPALVTAWTDGALTPALGLFPALGAFTVSFAVANVLAMFFNGAQAMKFQISTMVLMAIVNISASVYLASRIGVAGVAVGSVLAVVSVLVVPGCLYLPKLLHQLAATDAMRLRSPASPD